MVFLVPCQSFRTEIQKTKSIKDEVGQGFSGAQQKNTPRQEEETGRRGKNKDLFGILASRGADTHQCGPVLGQTGRYAPSTHPHGRSWSSAPDLKPLLFPQSPGADSMPQVSTQTAPPWPGLSCQELGTCSVLGS